MSSDFRGALVDEGRMEAVAVAGLLVTLGGTIIPSPRQAVHQETTFRDGQEQSETGAARRVFKITCLSGSWADSPSECMHPTEQASSRARSR